MRGWHRRSRQRRLVYHSLGGGCWVGAIATDPVVLGAADLAVTASRPCNGMFSENSGGINPLRTSIPASGVVGLSVTIIARETSAIGQSTFYVMDWDDDRAPLGLAAASMSGRGAGAMYFGKVVNHYDAQSIAYVKTGGSGNTQFKFAINNAATGSVSYYIRVTGYWVEVE